MGLEKFLDKNGVLFLWGKIKAAFATKDSATSTENGLMSSADKVKLDGIATGANKYVHPSYTPKESGLYKITVTKKFGVCYLNGGITLTAAVSGWVTLLDSNAVPAPQNGEAIIMTLPSWKAPTTNPARLRIPADGGLQITRGSANAFGINLAYPIN